MGKERAIDGWYRGAIFFLVLRLRSTLIFFLGSFLETKQMQGYSLPRKCPPLGVPVKGTCFICRCVLPCKNWWFNSFYRCNYMCLYVYTLIQIIYIIYIISQIQKPTHHQHVLLIFLKPSKLHVQAFGERCKKALFVKDESAMHQVDPNQLEVALQLGKPRFFC